MGAKNPMFLPVDSEDFDQARQIPKLIRVFAWRWSFCWFCRAVAQIFYIYASENSYADNLPIDIHERVADISHIFFAFV